MFNQMCYAELTTHTGKTPVVCWDQGQLQLKRQKKCTHCFTL